MSVRDPYSSVRDEVLKEMRVVNTLYGQWKELCQNGSAPQINAATAKIREHLNDVDDWLEEMEKANSIVERDISKFGFDQDEMKSRKTFVANYRKKVRDISDDLAVPFDKRLFEASDSINQDTRYGASSGPNKAQRYQDAINKDNEAYVANQEQRQEELFQQHDEQFDVLHGHLTHIGEISRTMGDELKYQNELLDKMNDEAGQTEDELKSITRKVGKLIERMQANCGWVCIGILVLVLILVSFLALAI